MFLLKEDKLDKYLEKQSKSFAALLLHTFTKFWEQVQVKFRLRMCIDLDPRICDSSSSLTLMTLEKKTGLTLSMVLA